MVTEGKGNPHQILTISKRNQKICIIMQGIKMYDHENNDDEQNIFVTKR